MREILPIYPAVDEIFELTLDGDAPENQPLEMVRRDGYDPNGWQKCSVIKGRRARRFKLVKVGYCRTFEEVQRRLRSYSQMILIPEGEWREALKAAYRSDGKGPVGIADSSWVGPDGNAYFPCVDTGGDSHFHRTHCGFDVDWRWLVKADNRHLRSLGA